MTPTATATSDPVPELVDVKAICQSVLEAIAPRATAQRVTVDVALAPEPACVVAIPGLLRGALHRMMLRALGAMPGGGMLSVFIQRRGGMVAIDFADTGFDVPTNLRAVRAVCRAIGGSMTRTSNADGGTRFVVEIPAAAPEQDAGSPCKDRRVTSAAEHAGEQAIGAAAL
jgi:signal transduction histidine kinase